MRLPSGPIGGPLRRITAWVGGVLLAIGGLFAYGAWKQSPALFIPAAIFLGFGFGLIRAGRKMGRSLERMFGGATFEDLIPSGMRASGHDPAAAPGLREAAATVRGVARVVAIDTPSSMMLVNQNPVATLDLEVQVPGRASFRTRARTVVPLVMLGQVRIGADLPVHVSEPPAEEVRIDWDAAGDPEGSGHGEVT